MRVKASFYAGVLFSTWITTAVVGFWSDDMLIGNLLFNGAAGIFFVWIAMRFTAEAAFEKVCLRLLTSRHAILAAFAIGSVVAAVGVFGGLFAVVLTFMLAEAVGKTNVPTIGGISVWLGITLACMISSLAVRAVLLFTERKYKR
jgi:hypothetical protein